jgi:hypothetical protein
MPFMAKYTYPFILPAAQNVVVGHWMEVISEFGDS